MNINWNNSILTSDYENLTINNYLNILFVKNWSITVDYSTYFDHCSPSMCTYTIKERRTFSYAITLFISLYGGLIIILRLFASCCIDILFKLKDYSSSSNQDHPHRNICQPIHSIKQLNLFKNIHDRTESSVIQQRIITRVYLILLSSKNL